MNIPRHKASRVPEWLKAERANRNHANVDNDGQYKVLFSIRNWRITIDVQNPDVNFLDGPSMWHKGCSGFTHILSRSNPQCQKCGIKIPERIQTVYTLINWEHGTKEEYFVD